jgi:hypothetical protein
MDIRVRLRELVTANVIDALYVENNTTLTKAFDTVYNSTYYKKLEDLETGLYQESSAYNYDLLKDELKYGKFVQNEI